MYRLLLLFIISALYTGCIGDDVIDDRVPEQVTIINPIDSLQIGSTFQLVVDFFDNIGRKTDTEISFTSSNENVATVSSMGLVEGINLGNAVITVSAQGDDGTITDEMELVISEDPTTVGNNVRVGSIATTSSYVLEGGFEIHKTDGGVELILLDDWKTTDALPGLYVYLGNNPSSIANALEIGPITQFEGRHSYQVPNVQLFEYQYVLFWCKPFGVKVGQGDFVE